MSKITHEQVINNINVLYDDLLNTKNASDIPLSESEISSLLDDIKIYIIKQDNLLELYKEKHKLEDLLNNYYIDKKIKLIKETMLKLRPINNQIKELEND